MFKLWGNKKLFILLSALIFFIAVMGLTYIQRDAVEENTSWPVRFVRDSVTWTQQLFYKPVAYVTDFIQDVRNLRTVYEENEELRRTVAQQALDRVKLNRLEDENVRLARALDFTEEQMEMNNYRYHIAQVVSVNSDPFNHTVRVNIGSKHGIKKDWAVITYEGYLIGSVEQADPYYSTVRLITNLDEAVHGNESIAATVSGNDDAFGMIQNYDRETGMLIMTKIRQDDPLKSDDIIVTSGLGELFPKGLIIGTVKDKEVGEFGIDYKATIEPDANFSNIREVFIVEVPGL